MSISGIGGGSYSWGPESSRFSLPPEQAKEIQDAVTTFHKVIEGAPRRGFTITVSAEQYDELLHKLIVIMVDPKMPQDCLDQLRFMENNMSDSNIFQKQQDGSYSADADMLLAVFVKPLEEMGK